MLKQSPMENTKTVKDIYIYTHLYRICFENEQEQHQFIKH